MGGYKLKVSIVTECVIGQRLVCRSFASRLAAVPMLILAVTECSSAKMFFESEQSQSLLTKANEFADSCNASFITTCTNFEQQCTYHTDIALTCIPQMVYLLHALPFARGLGRLSLLSSEGLK